MHWNPSDHRNRSQSCVFSRNLTQSYWPMGTIATWEKWRLHLFVLLYMWINYVKWSGEMYQSCIGSHLFFFSFFLSFFSFFFLTFSTFKCPLLSEMCCYSLRALTHNVCALFVSRWLLMFACYWCTFTSNDILDIPCLSFTLSELLLCFWTNSPWPKNDNNRE